MENIKIIVSTEKVLFATQRQETKYIKGNYNHYNIEVYTPERTSQLPSLSSDQNRIVIYTHAIKTDTDFLLNFRSDLIPIVIVDGEGFKKYADKFTKLTATNAEVVYLIDQGIIQADINFFASREPNKPYSSNLNSIDQDEAIQANYDKKFYTKAQNIFTSISEKTNNKALNIDLIACYSGAAIKDIEYLPKFSTLTTFSDSDYEMSSIFFERGITESKQMLLPYNAFFRFAAYIATQPNTMSFATFDSETESHKIFIADIKEINNYSIAGIKQWQTTQIRQYAEFLKPITSSPENNQQIAKFLEFVDNTSEFTNWINSFNTPQYQLCLLATLVNNHLASSDITKIQQLLSEIKDLNLSVSEDNDNILYSLFLSDSNKEVIELILNAGANPNHISNLSKSPVSSATSIGLAQLYIAYGGDINIILTNGPRTGLHLLTKYVIDDPEYTDFLIKNGAKANLIDTKGWSPLLHATFHGRIEIIKSMIKFDQNIDLNQPATDEQAVRPLSIALHRNNLELAILYISLGADISLTLPHFFNMNQDTQIGLINYLKETCTAKNAKAIHHTLQSMIKIMTELKNEAEFIQIHQQKLLTDLEYLKAEAVAHPEMLIEAIENANYDLAILLINNALIDLNYANGKGFTALHAAAFKGNTAIITLLMARKVDIDPKTPKGNTPLHLASNAGHYEAVKLLIDNGADFSLTTASGKTSLMIAEEKNYADIVKYLQDKITPPSLTQKLIIKASPELEATFNLPSIPKIGSIDKELPAITAEATNNNPHPAASKFNIHYPIGALLGALANPSIEYVGDLAIKQNKNWTDYYNKRLTTENAYKSVTSFVIFSSLVLDFEWSATSSSIYSSLFSHLLFEKPELSTQFVKNCAAYLIIPVVISGYIIDKMKHSHFIAEDSIAAGALAQSLPTLLSTATKVIAFHTPEVDLCKLVGYCSSDHDET